MKHTRMPDLLGLADDLLAAGSLRSFTLSLRRVAPPSEDDGQTVTIDLTITADPSTAPDLSLDNGRDVTAKVIGPVAITMSAAVQYGGDKVAPSCSDVETTY